MASVVYDSDSSTGSVLKSGGSLSFDGGLHARAVFMESATRAFALKKGVSEAAIAFCAPLATRCFNELVEKGSTTLPNVGAAKNEGDRVVVAVSAGLFMKYLDATGIQNCGLVVPAMIESFDHPGDRQIPVSFLVPSNWRGLQQRMEESVVESAISTVEVAGQALFNGLTAASVSAAGWIAGLAFDTGWSQINGTVHFSSSFKIGTDAT